jgi:glyoxylase-like metal-dependent hydrolase (beta-lactamase superfamily II)
VKVSTVVAGVHRLELGAVSVYVVDDDEGPLLIDTGYPDTVDQLVAGLGSLGYRAGDVSGLLVTHCHGDHAGGLAQLEVLTGARSFMHAADAAMVRKGQAWRPWVPGPGLVNRLIFRSIDSGTPRTVEPARVSDEVADGERIALAGGIRAVHLPGHCLGMLGFLLERSGVMFVADAASRVGPLQMSPNYEDVAIGRESLSRLSSYSFDVACFAHGRPLKRRASAVIGQRWPPHRQSGPLGL